MKEKRTLIKTAAVLAITLILCIFTATCSFADEYSEPTNQNGDFSAIGGEYTEIYEENAVDIGVGGTNIADNVGNDTQNEPVIEQNVFEQLYAAVCEYAAEILSTLTLIGTLIVGFAYKKGLLPLVTRAISAIQNSVNKIKADTEKGTECTKDALECVCERLSAIENSLSLLSEDIMELETKLECESECIKERKKMKVILSSQVDMLYDIFMSSSLPQYQKDATGARIQSMREELGTYEKSEKQ